MRTDEQPDLCPDETFYNYPPDLLGEHMHHLTFGAADEGERAPWRHVLRLGGRCASRWASAVFLALRSPANDSHDELTDADKAFLAFIADRVVREIMADTPDGSITCKT